MMNDKSISYFIYMPSISTNKLLKGGTLLTAAEVQDIGIIVFSLFDSEEGDIVKFLCTKVGCCWKNATQLWLGVVRYMYKGKFWKFEQLLFSGKILISLQHQLVVPLYGYNFCHCVAPLPAYRYILKTMNSYDCHWNIGLHLTKMFSCVLLYICVSVILQRNVHHHVELNTLHGTHLEYKQNHNSHNALVTEGDFNTIYHGIIDKTHATVKVFYMSFSQIYPQLIVEVNLFMGVQDLNLHVLMQHASVFLWDDTTKFCPALHISLEPLGFDYFEFLGCVHSFIQLLDKDLDLDEISITIQIFICPYLEVLESIWDTPKYYVGALSKPWENLYW